MVNFFYLHNNPTKCARYYCNKHVLKIPIEIAQILCNIHYELSENVPPYKKCLAVKSTLGPYVWIKESLANYKYAVALGIALINEYKYRYNKESHKTENSLKWLSKNLPDILPDIGPTPFRMTHQQSMYQYLSEDSVFNSRFMYTEIKCTRDSWRNRSTPKWYLSMKLYLDKQKPILVSRLSTIVNRKSNSFSKQINALATFENIKHTDLGTERDIFFKAIINKLLGVKNNLTFDRIAELKFPQLVCTIRLLKRLKQEDIERIIISSFKIDNILKFPINGIDYRLQSYYYRFTKNEVGVLSVEPYKSEILPHWRFKTPEIARKSSNKIYALFKEYLRTDDLIGADMTRKYIQMGVTRSKRYYNWKSGKKYDSDGSLRYDFPGQPEKLKSSEIFLKKLRKIWQNKKYIVWTVAERKPKKTLCPGQYIFDKKIEKNI